MDKNNFVDITQCRLCKSRSLKSFVDFGNVALGNDLQASANKAKLSNTYPLNIMRCDNCHHFQLSVSVDPGLLYANNYTYLSSIGKTFVEHLSQYADWVHCKVLKNEKDLVKERKDYIKNDYWLYVIDFLDQRIKEIELEERKMTNEI